MAIDYVIDKDCKAKQLLTREGLMVLIKARDRASQAASDKVTYGNFREVKFKRRVAENEHAWPMDINTLEYVKDYCHGCPYQALGIYQSGIKGGVDKNVSFCCYNHIDYPVSARAEEWLAGVARSAIEEGGDRKALIDFIIDTGDVGQQTARIRADAGGAFFELHKPLEIPVSAGPAGPTVINTDQLFALVFGIDEIQLPHMFGLLQLSGAYSVLSQKPELGYSFILTSTSPDGEKKWLAFRDIADDADDLSTRQLKDFFRSLFLAFTFNHRVVIDA